MVESLGVMAALFELIAVYLLGKKNIYGFVAGIVCNILWVIYVMVAQNTYGLLLVCLCAFILNIKGYLNWKK